MFGRVILAPVRRKPLGWAFHLLSLALGVAVVVALLAIDKAIDDRFQRDLDCSRCRDWGSSSRCFPPCRSASATSRCSARLVVDPGFIAVDPA